MKSFLEHTVLLMQSLSYLAVITFLVVLALWFQQSMSAQTAYHEREDAKLLASLHRSEQLLYESRQALQDHQRQMERLAR